MTAIPFQREAGSDTGIGRHEMLTFQQIQKAVESVAPKYNVKTVTLFGSYASGRANENSDVDFLVEFKSRPVTLYMLIAMEQEISAILGIDVEIAAMPLPEKSRLFIEKELPVYAA
jgi:predicted nucleotidyltransferase